MWYLISVAALTCIWLALSPRCALRLYEMLLFQPNKHKGEQSELDAMMARNHGEHVQFANRSGRSIHAVVLGPVETAKRVMLYIIGRDGDIATRASLLERLVNDETAVLIYEPTGYGATGGRATLPAVCNDALDAYDFCVTLAAGRNVVVFGESLGGSVAAWLSTRRPLCGIIVKSTFASFRRIVKELCPLLRLYPRALFPSEPDLHTAGNLADQEAPVLVIHGKADNMINYRHALKLHARLGDKSKLVSLPESRHAFLSDADAATLTSEVRAFVASVARTVA